MEKSKPHHPLETVKELVRAGSVRATNVAMRGAHLLGLGPDDVLEAVLSLSRADFYKSMTSYADNHEWQDVYRPVTKVGSVYLKLTIRNGVLILSFKEL